jgi:DNA modification methylase
MKTYYEDDQVKLYNGSVLDDWPILPLSVSCCVTSPPYWGLRDYGLQPEIWGGDSNCNHEWGIAKGNKNIGRDDAFCGGIGNLKNDEGTKGFIGYKKPVNSQYCQLCNAWRGCLGLEPTPELYIEHLIFVFGKVWEVLRDDGTLWVNIGDSYAGSQADGVKSSLKQLSNKGSYGVPGIRIGNNLKPKDLCLIPFHFAIAMQRAGWYVRSDIIWAKPNPMPESVMDRPTSSYEHIFLFTKKERYFYDADAVREENTQATIDRFLNGAPRKRNDNREGTPYKWQQDDIGESPLSGRNLRNVWTIATRAYNGAHFATFPPELPEKCILAGTPTKICAICGNPWIREVERTEPTYSEERNKHNFDGRKVDGINNYTSISKGRPDNSGVGYRRITTLGFIPSCDCNGETKPSTVLDIFGGSGTTAEVALKLGHNVILIEANPEYCELAVKRLQDIISQNRLF